MVSVCDHWSMTMTRAEAGRLARMPAVDRFNLQWQASPNGCHEWTGILTTGGYGQFTLNGKRTTAHRAAYVLFVGEIPEGQHIDHLCRNRRCVNVAHLEAVLPLENMDRAGNQRVLRRFDTHCARGHERTEANTYWKKNGTRRCRLCDRILEGRRVRST